MVHEKDEQCHKRMKETGSTVLPRDTRNHVHFGGGIIIIYMNGEFDSSGWWVPENHEFHRWQLVRPCSTLPLVLRLLLHLHHLISDGICDAAT